MCTLAVHWGWRDTVPGFPDRLRENPPRQGFFAAGSPDFEPRLGPVHCLRELKKIKVAWPDLHYQTVAGALVLSPPRIAPAQLRLVDGRVR